MDFIANIFKELHKVVLDDPLARTIADICLIFEFLMLVALILYTMFRIIDSWFMIEKHTACQILNKEIKRRAITFGGPYPSTLAMTILMLDRKVNVAVRRKYYESMSVGSSLIVKYVRGRLSHHIYIRSPWYL